ncbi:hypothetical protein ACFY9H_33400 [Streptomyces bacillaris]|nr:MULTISPECIES: hypothetical protein [Streptomyces]
MRALLRHLLRAAGDLAYGVSAGNAIRLGLTPPARRSPRIR